MYTCLFLSFVVPGYCLQLSELGGKAQPLIVLVSDDISPQKRLTAANVESLLESGNAWLLRRNNECELRLNLLGGMISSPAENSEQDSAGGVVDSMEDVNAAAGETNKNARDILPYQPDASSPSCAEISSRAQLQSASSGVENVDVAHLLRKVVQKSLFISQQDADNLLLLRDPILRVFLSSTFTDTAPEKDHLMTSVFPKIHSLCAQSRTGLIFETVDMRWGVTDEASKNHQTWQMCRDEIDECARRSMGLFFLCLYADKYGWRPPPHTISLSMWKKIVDGGLDDESKEKVRRWYELDENFKDEPRMVLKTLSSDEMSNAFWGKSDAMISNFEIRALLETGAKKSGLSEEEALPFVASVTEQEIRHATQQLALGSRAVWLRRRIVDPSNVQERFEIEKLGERYRRDYLYLDEEEKQLLDKLERDVRQYFGRTRSFPINSKKLFKSSLKFSNRFGNVISKWLEEEVDRAKHRLENAPAKSSAQRAFVQEILHHVAIVVERGVEFPVIESRRQQVEEVRKHIASGKGVMVVQAPSGAGKTSFLATAALLELQGDRGNKGKTATIIRFLGTTHTSSTTQSMLESVFRQVLFCCSATNDDDDSNSAAIQAAVSESLPNNFVDLVDQICTAVPTKTKKSGIERVVFILDSLDQLDELQIGWKKKERKSIASLSWIKRLADAGIVLLLSALTEASFDIEGKLTAAGVEYEPVALSEICESDFDSMVSTFLDKRNRQLTVEQKQKVVASLSASSSETKGALFFGIVMERVASCSHGDELEIPNTVGEAIDATFNRLEKQYGKEVVRSILGLLSASRRGLSSREMCDILSLDTKLLEDGGPVFQYHVPSLRIFPSTIWHRLVRDLGHFLTGAGVKRWCHRQHVEAAKARYLIVEKHHAHLADYFAGRNQETRKELGLHLQQWVLNDGKTSLGQGANPRLCGLDEPIINDRKVLEVLFHAQQRKSGLRGYKDEIISLEYIECRCRIGDTFNMIKDLAQIVEEHQKSSSSATSSADTFERDVYNVYRFVRRFGSQLHEYPQDTIVFAASCPVWSCLSPESESSSSSAAFFPRIERMIAPSCESWDPVLSTLPLRSIVRSVTFSPDRRHIAGVLSDGSVRFWNFWTGEEALPLQGHRGATNSVTYSRDGIHFATASKDKTVRIWDAINGNCVLEIKNEHVFNDARFAGVDDNLIICVSEENENVWVYDVETGREVFKLEGHKEDIKCLRCSPDGRSFATVTFQDKDYEEQIIVWNALDGSIRLTINDLRGFPRFCFSPDSSELLVVGMKKESENNESILRVYDTDTGTCRCKTKVAGVGQLAWSRFGETTRILSSFGDQLSLRNEALECQGTMTLSDHCLRIDWSPDERHFAIALSTGIDICDAEDFRSETSETTRNDWKQDRSIQFSPNGTAIISRVNARGVSVFDINSRAEIARIERKEVDEIQYDDSVWVNEDELEEYAASNITENKLTVEHLIFGDQVVHVAFANYSSWRSHDIVSCSADGKFAVMGFANGAVVMWDIANKTFRHLLRSSFVKEQEFCGKVVFGDDEKEVDCNDKKEDCDDKKAASGGFIYNPSFELVGRNRTDEQHGQHREAERLGERTPEIRSICFSLDGFKIACGTQNWDILVWDLRNAEEELVLKGHTDYVFSVAFSPDGRRLVSGSRDCSARLWEIETWRIGGQMSICCDNPPDMFLRRNTGGVTSVSFSPNGTQIVGGWDDGSIYVWNMCEREGKLSLVLFWIASTRGPSITSVCFSPDGHRIASAAEDGNIHIWRLKEE